MAEDPLPAAAPLHDRAQVRIFTLADYLAEEESEKLYVSGAGLEWTGVPARPETDERGERRSLLFFYLLVRLAFPRSMVRESHVVEIFVLKRDGSPAGPDSLMRATMGFDMSQAPPDFTEMSGNLTLRITGFPASVEPDDVVFFDLVVDDVTVSRLPVQLQLDDR